MDLIRFKTGNKDCNYVRSTNSYMNNFKFIDDDKRKTLK